MTLQCSKKQKFFPFFFSDIQIRISKFKKANEDPTLKREASLQRFLHKLKQKTFLMELNMINCILLVLLLLVSVELLKYTNSPLVIHFLNFIPLFHLQVLLVIILPVSFVIFIHLQFLMITLAKILFLFFLKLRMQIFPENFLFPVMQLVFLLIFHFRKPLIQQ